MSCSGVVTRETSRTCIPAVIQATVVQLSYKLLLVKRSTIVLNVMDSNICPSRLEKVVVSM
jgi:hypothetical protein